MIEVNVSGWKGGLDVTDEEWIPQHQILHFRNRHHDKWERIWDRAGRLDRMFGSGIRVSDDLEYQKEHGLTNEIGGKESCKGGCFAK